MKKYFILTLIALLAPQFVFAGDATMHLSSFSGAYLAKKSFTSRVILNSGYNNVNAAESIIKFDPNYIKVEKITKDKSIFKLWTVEPKIDNTKGTITFGGGLPGSFRDSAGLIFDLTIYPKKTGTTSMEIASTSQILKADGEAENLFKIPNYGYYVFGSSATVSNSNSLRNRFTGNILLQVEDAGKAWYIYPNDKKRYYLGRPEDAFNIMRKLGLGATHKYITTYQNKTFPTAVSGKILLDVEDSGKAYYIYPKNRKAYYLGRPADAFKVMRELGAGISNTDINKIPDWAI